jgi:hypothetical protein
MSACWCGSGIQGEHAHGVRGHFGDAPLTEREWARRLSSGEDDDVRGGLLTCEVCLGTYPNGSRCECLSPCCGAATTYHDDVLCCKSCWREVPE